MSEAHGERAPGVEDFRELFELDPRHTLSEGRGKLTRNATRVRETRWFEERAPDGRLIACYRTWRENYRRPPYRIVTGWERWSPTGALLAREVRRSSVADRTGLHSPRNREVRTAHATPLHSGSFIIKR